MSFKGHFHTTEFKEKMKKLLKGRKITWRDKISETKKGMNLTMSDSQKQNISNSMKGKIPWNKGKQNCFDKDSLEKIRQSATGRKHTEEFKERLRQERIGEKNPAWQGGISKNPYPVFFNDKLKEKIRNRDNRKCQECWKTEKENGMLLDVHHIDYDKENCKEENLISLCRKCNVLANSAREKIKEKYQTLLRNPKVFVSILNDGFLRTELSFPLIKWMKETENRVYLEMPSDRPIENNRNMIVKRFLNSDCDFLLQIDNDNVPMKNPLYLLNIMKEQNIDILSCPVWIYQYKLILNIYKYDENGEYLIPVDYEKNKDSGLIEIDSTGTGILLCSRNVLERLERPFERIYDEKYGIETMGLDIAFSQKAKKAGFKIFSHMSFISKHYKMIDLSLFN